MTIKQAFEKLTAVTAAAMKNPFFVNRRLHETFADIADKIVDGGGVTPEEMEAVTGKLADLTTTAKTNLVAGINEVNAGVGDLSTLTTTAKTSAVDAINEVNGNITNNVLGNIVDIYSYNSIENMYTIPKDGYITTVAKSQGNYIEVKILGSTGTNGSTISTGSYGANDTIRRCSAVFVRKGMKAYIEGSAGANLDYVIARFVPLN